MCGGPGSGVHPWLAGWRAVEPAFRGAYYCKTGIITVKIHTTTTTASTTTTEQHNIVRMRILYCSNLCDIAWRVTSTVANTE